MPFVRVTLASPSLTEPALAALRAGVTRLMAETLAKRADLTAVLVERVAPGAWSVGAEPVDVAAHLAATVTAGRNSPAQKADFIAAAHRNSFNQCLRDFFFVIGGDDSQIPCVFLARIALFEPFLRPVQSFPQPRFFDGFQQVIDRVKLKCLHRKLVISRHESDERKRSFTEQFDGFQTGNLRHLQIEERQIRFRFFDYLDGFRAIFRFADDFHIFKTLKQSFEKISRRAFIVGNDNS